MNSRKEEKLKLVIESIDWIKLEIKKTLKNLKKVEKDVLINGLTPKHEEFVEEEERKQNYLEKKLKFEEELLKKIKNT